MFKAILVKQSGAAELSFQDEKDLPDGDVTVLIDYSTINYKDGIVITGRMPLVKSFPMVPGIDFAGVVEASSNPRWNLGDQVILNGHGVERNIGAASLQRRKLGGTGSLLCQANFVLATPWQLELRATRQCCAL